MSAIADFRLFETSKLNQLRDNAEIRVEKKLFGNKVIDNYPSYLSLNSKKLKDFKYSGYIFANLLIFLAENKDIDLLKGAHDNIADSVIEKRKNTTIILTYDHREKYLSKLNADNFTLEELISFNKDFSDDDDAGLAKAEIEGIKALRENLELLTGDHEVILLSIG